MSDYVVRDIDKLADTALSVLDTGVEIPGFALIQGRVMAVQGSPDLENAEEMAWGISALPAGYSVPPHTHPAEELAMIVRGAGSITIGDDVIPVAEGSVVVTPPHLRHVTTAGSDGPMVVYWVYAPPGSEVRWLETE